MIDDRDTRVRCTEMIASLRQELDLTPEQAAAYVQAIATYLPDRSTDAQLLRLIQCYHLDHQEVQALGDPQHARYQVAWESWRKQVPRILRRAQLDWLADAALDLEDLTQIALTDLNESIAKYRFGSRFSTWAYTVIVRAGQHVIRERRAAKRTGQLVSLDDEVAVARPADQATDPEAQAGASELNALITAILAERGGPNWVKIFRLWAHEDRRLVDIGQQIGLSPSRVSVLLDQMRQLLRQHPALLEWRQLSNGEGEPASPAEQEYGGAQNTADNSNV
jgi:RNA polymerase sigma factor (sigma-70 family)